MYSSRRMHVLQQENACTPALLTYTKGILMTTEQAENQNLSEQLVTKKIAIKEGMETLTDNTMRIIHSDLTLNVIKGHIKDLEAFSKSKRASLTKYTLLFKQDNTIRYNILYIMGKLNIPSKDIIAQHKKIYTLNPTYTLADFKAFFEGITDKDFKDQVKEKQKTASYWRTRYYNSEKTVAERDKTVAERDKTIKKLEELLCI